MSRGSSSPGWSAINSGAGTKVHQGSESSSRPGDASTSHLADERLLPARRWSGLLVSEGRARAVVPTPDAMTTVGHTGDGRSEETPVNVAASGGGVEWLPGVWQGVLRKGAPD